jgi:hypothetical protein
MRIANHLDMSKNKGESVYKLLCNGKQVKLLSMDFKGSSRLQGVYKMPRKFNNAFQKRS